jgi:hypothetical protein
VPFANPSTFAADAQNLRDPATEPVTSRGDCDENDHTLVQRCARRTRKTRRYDSMDSWSLSAWRLLDRREVRAAHLDTDRRAHARRERVEIALMGMVEPLSSATSDMSGATADDA